MFLWEDRESIVGEMGGRELMDGRMRREVGLVKGVRERMLKCGVG